MKHIKLIAVAKFKTTKSKVRDKERPSVVSYKLSKTKALTESNVINIILDIVLLNNNINLFCYRSG